MATPTTSSRVLLDPARPASGTHVRREPQEAALALLVAVASCHPTTSPAKEDAMGRSSTRDPEVETHLRFAQPRTGERAELAERDAAVRWLVEHADRAYPRVLELATARPDDAAMIERLGRLDGLRVRGDRAACARVVPLTTNADAEVRWMAVDAAARLGCLDDAALAAIAAHDGDANVRKHAAELRRLP